MESENPKFPKVLLIIVLWLLFTTFVLFIGYPKVKEAMAQSGVLSLFVSHQSSTQPVTQHTRTVSVAFVLPDKKIKHFSYQSPRYGSSALHDTFEALLAPLPIEALKEGAITYIAPTTRLRGVTLSNSILFVDFTSEFLSSPDLTLAQEQVRETALESSAIKGVQILIEGELYLTPQRL